MIFNPAEAAALTAAVETYDEHPRNQIPWETQHSVSLSVLRKLDTLTALTVFSKQEFTLMLLAVDSMLTSFRHAGQPSDPILLILYNRLFDLSDPLSR